MMSADLSDLSSCGNSAGCLQMPKPWRTLWQVQVALAGMFHRESVQRLVNCTHSCRCKSF
jgi:hypothetical protein